MVIEASAVNRGADEHQLDGGADDGMQCVKESALRESVNHENLVNYSVSTDSAQQSDELRVGH